ncbi:hypothetical protein F4V89_10770 [Neorhizobium galegae]|nr:hypothetical protein F4V89_10770 [Neorhizobium galegae]
MGGLFAGPANQMPVNGIAAPAKPNIQLVDRACGRGFELTRRGFCRPSRWAPPPPPRYFHQTMGNHSDHGCTRPSRRW